MGSGAPDPSHDARRRALERFAAHRQAWARNAALRALYTRWYDLVRRSLPPPERGPWIEIGSGPGFAREFIPGLELSDLVKAPWHDRELAAEALPFAEGSVGALVLFDVLHHLPAPARFFTEAVRVLAPGGRVVLCEPYVSPVSYPVYRWLHEEGADTRADPLADATAAPAGRDPFAGNQAIPTILFRRRRAHFERRFPELRVLRVEALTGLAYPASGGFSRPPLLPGPVWRGLAWIEDRLPAWAFRLIGFRLLVVLERA